MISTKNLRLNSIMPVKIKAKKEGMKTEKSKGLSNNVIKSLCRERTKLERELSKLNITEEMRKKTVLELTEEEKDVLYDEYVLTSAIEGTTDFIEGRYYTSYEFEKELNSIREEVENEWQLMQS